MLDLFLSGVKPQVTSWVSTWETLVNSDVLTAITAIVVQAEVFWCGPGPVYIPSREPGLAVCTCSHWSVAGLHVGEVRVPPPTACSLAGLRCSGHPSAPSHIVSG